MKKLTVAESAGFCFGVNRSVDMAERLIEENGSKVVGIITLIELTDLKGRELFKDTPVVTFMKVPH